MRWVQSEYALKGLFLGLLLYTALQIQILPKPAEDVKLTDSEIAARENQPWEKTGIIAIYLVAGLGAGLVLGIVRQIRDLAHLFKKPHAFIVFLLLENPLLIYIGLIGGLGIGAVTEFKSGDGAPNLIVLSICGAILGYGYSQLHDIKDVRYRLGISVVVGAAVIYALVMWLEEFSGGQFLLAPKREMLGIDILLGLPFFWLLCFVGIAEESEAEIAGLCTMLGFAIYLLKFPANMPTAGFLLPMALYFTYVMYVLPSLRVFKHTLRGYTYLQVGKLTPSLLAFRRALQIEPNNQLAQQGMDSLHASIEFERVDAAILGLLDPNRCLAIVRRLLHQAPTPDQRNKAIHLLNLVEKLWPKLTSQVNYYRAVLAIHAHDLDKASELLTDLLTPEGWFPDDAARKAILFDAWQLVLLVHPGLKQRVGEPQLALPGRRMEAIGAVERQLAQEANDPAVLDFRATLYAGLYEDEFVEAARNALPTDFSYRYAEELGLGMIGEPERWQRGAQYLRMAAAGQQLRRPSIYQRLADASAKAGETMQARKYLQLVRDAGVDVGPKTLPADQRTIYFTTIKRLADEAAAEKDFDEAIYDYNLYTQFDGAGKETRRALAEMYEGKKLIFDALRLTETGLVYDKTDADLLQKKDRYYYSLEPEILAKVNAEDDRVRKYFDVDYCIKKAKSVLDGRDPNLDLLDWAEHLLKLALVMQPKNLIALVQKSRVLLRRGERDEALRILEDIKELKPSGSEETEAWYFVHKQLGKIYLDELNRPELAIPVFLEFLNHLGSGAETNFDLARAYEANNEIPKAIKYYSVVTAYEGHPLVWEAEQAIRRLKDNPRPNHNDPNPPPYTA